jgi:hypothetical protein
MPAVDLAAVGLATGAAATASMAALRVSLKVELPGNVTHPEPNTEARKIAVSYGPRVCTA